MKLLTLLRHAKSSWQDSNQSDHDRPLNDRGLRDAPDMAQRLLEAKCTPDKILCSTAQRTRETAQHVIQAHSLPADVIQFDDALYLASAGTLLEFIEHTKDTVNHLMIIGHNPGLEVLGRQMHNAAPSQLPTCAVLHFAIHSSEFTLESETEIELLQFDFPKSRKK